SRPSSGLRTDHRTCCLTGGLTRRRATDVYRRPLGTWRASTTPRSVRGSASIRWIVRVLCATSVTRFSCSMRLTSRRSPGLRRSDLRRSSRRRSSCTGVCVAVVISCTSVRQIPKLSYCQKCAESTVKTAGGSRGNLHVAILNEMKKIGDEQRQSAAADVELGRLVG